MRARNAWLMTSVFTLAVGHAGAAAAEAEEPTDPSEPTASVHDGFQLRVGLGGGYLRDDMEANWLFGSASGKAEGASAAFQLAIGFGLGKGWFLGPGVFTDTVTDPEITFEGSTRTSDVKLGTLTVAGVYANYYLTDNWNLFAAGGGANIRTRDDEGTVDDESAAGAGICLGGGYDMWIADSYTLGGAVRLTQAGLWGDFVSHSVTAFSLLLTGTYD